jgi:hypothetical protein
MTDTGFLQFGENVGPFLTLEVPIKHEYADRYKAFYEGKWRRVNIQVNRTFIVCNGEKITIQIDGV